MLKNSLTRLIFAILVFIYAYPVNSDDKSTTDIATLLQKLKSDKYLTKLLVFRQISEQGQLAQPAGAQLEQMVRTDDEFSGTAAETLGWIGYTAGTQSLINALSSRNWELVYQATWSLGQLRATEARERLEHVRDSHWSHLVTTQAQKSLTVLDQPLPDFTHVQPDSVVQKFRDFQYMQSRESTCSNAVEWQGERLTLEWNSTLPPSSKPLKIPAFIPKQATKETRAIMAVDNGWLVGVSHGEFCEYTSKKILACGLHFYKKNGQHTVIAVGNVVGIYKTANNGLVYTQGVDHLMHIPGHAFKLTQTKANTWSTELLAITQASPQKTTLDSNGTLIIQTQGSVVAVTDNGDLKSVKCLDN